MRRLVRSGCGISVLVVLGLVVAVAGTSSADVTCVSNQCVINNGLAPPNPENIIDDWTYQDAFVHVRNVGCPPGWPGSGFPVDDCPSPGPPTEVEMADDGEATYLFVYDSSTVTMTGGSVLSGIVQALDSSTVTMTAGSARLRANHFSTITVTGGMISQYLSTYDSSTITIVGRGFEVDAVPVPYGDLTAQTGRLTGAFASGDPVDNVFYQGGWTETPCTLASPCSGIITLVSLPVICGDGFVEGTETCDDDGTTPDDGCDASCQIETGWICVGEPSLCSWACGNGVIDHIWWDEACDDGGTTPGDGCDDSCQIESDWTCAGEPSICHAIVCGDEIIDAPEICDDGGTTPGDGCDASCQIESGWICLGEPSVCTVCGNDVIEGLEQCDDGGTAPGDGCDASCQIESGWECSGEPSICVLRVCGNGIIGSGEACDDGGTSPGDGCDASCQIEPGWICLGQPSVCEYCSGAGDGDLDCVPDDQDNCLDVSNPSQADSDLDGYGNACDADYDDSGLVAGYDFGLLTKPLMASYDEEFDHDCDGAVGGTDYNTFWPLYERGLPGPSGLACAGSPPCPVTAHGCIEIHCNDAFDNDGDGFIDCADTDCLDAPECQ